MKRLCGCLSKKPARVAADDGTKGFSPQCTCKAFRETGTCKHLIIFDDSTQRDDAPVGKNVATATDTEVAQKPASPTDSTLPVLELPEFEGELQFGERVGRGASGASVFRCSFVKSVGTPPVPCAAKVLPLSATTFADMVEDFGREVSIMRRLQHPSLVEFFGARRVSHSPVPGADEAYVLCMELCDASLDELVQHRRERDLAFTPEELSHIMTQIAAGLSHIHQRGILHRDLKSANIYVKHSCHEDGDNVDANFDKNQVLSAKATALCFKIGDFGGAKVALRAHTLAQTPQWMAPEVVRQPEDGYDRSADMWSFGCILFELLELAVPYGDDITLPQLESALTEGKPPELSPEKPGRTHPQQFVELMSKCFALVPSERPTAEAAQEMAKS